MSAFRVTFANGSRVGQKTSFRNDLNLEEQTEAVQLSRNSATELRQMSPADQVFLRDQHTRHIVLKILVQEAARHEDSVLRAAARKSRSPLQCRLSAALASFGVRRPTARGPTFFTQVLRDVDTLMTDVTRDNYAHTLKELSAIRMWRVHQ